MSTAVKTPATRAIEATIELLAEYGIESTRDSGAFYPQPVGVLVSLPTLLRRGQASRTFTVPVLVVSGDPFNSAPVVDRVLALADDVAAALRVDAYRPSSWRSGVNAEPLPCYQLDVTVSVTETEVIP